MKRKLEIYLRDDASVEPYREKTIHTTYVEMFKDHVMYLADGDEHNSIRIDKNHDWWVNGEKYEYLFVHAREEA